MVKKLPSDFDIFSLSMLSRPLCIQTLANGRRSRASLCAISFSWCGNCRSWPPPWMSKRLAEQRLAHRRALDVPARPAEAVLARPLGVVGLARPWPPSTSRSRADRPCRRARPRARRRAAGRSTCPRACRSRETCAPHSSRRRSARGSRSPCFSSVAIISSICGTYCVARGSCVGRSMKSAVGVFVQRRRSSPR